MTKRVISSKRLKNKGKIKKTAKKISKNTPLLALKPPTPLKAIAASEVKSQKSGNKTLSPKLAEIIEKRKKAAGPQKGNALFAKPRGRRGRRPKGAAEYVPSNQEEESFVLESDYETLEYDTGIRLKEARDDRGFNVDRFEEFDEELNFDW